MILLLIENDDQSVLVSPGIVVVCSGVDQLDKCVNSSDSNFKHSSAAITKKI